MTLSTTTLGADLAAIIDDLPATMQWRGYTVTGTRAEITTRRRADMAGIIEDSDCEFVCDVSDFRNSTPPASGELVLIDGESMRVDSALKSQDGVSWRAFLSRD